MKKMKKLFVVLLALIMVFSFAACGEKNDPLVDGDGMENTTTNVGEADSSIETPLWTLNYDSSVWSYEEDDLYNDEDYSDIILIIPDGDSYLVNAEIRVSIDEPYSFRDYLTSYGFDQYEYAVNNAYEFTSIGGVDCLMQEGNYWGDPCLRYFNRIEEAGATVFIEIIGEYDDARVDALLAGLTINLEDIGNEDGPWYWEGEAFSADSHSAMAGTYTLNSQWIPINDCLITGETFNHAVAVSGDKAYILSNGILKQYAFDGASLNFESDASVEGDFDYICSTTDGNVWLSGFMEPLIAWKDGAQAASYDGPDSVAMHPSGTWGVSWFSGPECEIVSIAGGTISTAPVTFAEVSTIMHLMVDDNYIYVCGSAADDSGHKVFLYNKDGVLQKILTGENGDGMGSITFMAETSNGFIGLDGNMREVVLWTKDGSYIGTIDDEAIFGTYYPWFCGATKLSDGSILVIMTEDRADESAMEVVAFKLSGF